MSNDLPVILVSAADADVADAVISELIDDEVSCEEESSNCPGRVWELRNKYYRARVCVRAARDAPPPAAPHPAAPAGPASEEGGDTCKEAEAHLIYLAENECVNAEVLVRRARGCEQGGAIRLALCACARGGAPPDLRRAADRLGYELVWWRERESPPGGAGAGAGPFPVRRGVARAREALHAHVWPNLVLTHAHTHGALSRTHHPHTDTPPPPPPATDDEFTPFQSYQGGGEHATSDGSGGSDDDSCADEEEMMRRAELLGGALGAARGVRDGEGGRGERLLRAEQLVAAFCRALGTDIDSL